MSSLPKPTDTRPYRAPSATGPEITVTGKEQRQTLRQVGWLGGTGAFYALDEKPSLHEPGSFTPLWFIAHSDRIDEPAPAEDFTEYGHISQYPDGNRCAVSPMGTDRDSAAQQVREMDAMDQRNGPQFGRGVLVSRRVTRTAWVDVERMEETTRG